MATSSSTDEGLPKRGEVWRVNFDPTIGSEIRKIRPAVVISSDAIGRLPVKLVAPVTEWKDHFVHNLWHIRVDPDAGNGIEKPSAIDALQIRSVSIDRFIAKLGRVPTEILLQITTAVATVMEHE